MSEYVIANENLKLTVADAGAEIRSLVRLSDGAELMWQADPAFWGRTSPVLFPLVGNYRGKTSYYDGKAYSMGQHGFARDMVFTLKEQTEDSLLFSLCDTEATHEKYPFAFRLFIGYRLMGKTVTVTWQVENPAEETMYFSIGGHPAFLCDYNGGGLVFYKNGAPVNGAICSGIIKGDGSGCLSDRTKSFDLSEGKLPLSWPLFDEDALIFEDRQADAVAITDADHKPVLCVSFDAPLFGVWTPAGKNAPFVCIEPWYGRCDRTDFNQQLSQREYGNTLAAGETFEVYYAIEVF